MKDKIPIIILILLLLCSTAHLSSFGKIFKGTYTDLNHGGKFKTYFENYSIEINESNSEKNTRLLNCSKKYCTLIVENNDLIINEFHIFFTGYSVMVQNIYPMCGEKQLMPLAINNTQKFNDHMYIHMKNLITGFASYRIKLKNAHAVTSILTSNTKMEWYSLSPSSFLLTTGNHISIKSIKGINSSYFSPEIDTIDLFDIGEIILLHSFVEMSNIITPQCCLSILYSVNKSVWNSLTIHINETFNLSAGIMLRYYIYLNDMGRLPHVSITPRGYPIIQNINCFICSNKFEDRIHSSIELEQHSNIYILKLEDFPNSILYDIANLTCALKYLYKNVVNIHLLVTEYTPKVNQICIPELKKQHLYLINSKNELLKNYSFNFTYVTYRYNPDPKFKYDNRPRTQISMHAANNTYINYVCPFRSNAFGFKIPYTELDTLNVSLCKLFKRTQNKNMYITQFLNIILPKNFSIKNISADINENKYLNSSLKNSSSFQLILFKNQYFRREYMLIVPIVVSENYFIIHLYLYDDSCKTLPSVPSDHFCLLRSYSYIYPNRSETRKNYKNQSFPFSFFALNINMDIIEISNTKFILNFNHLFRPNFHIKCIVSNGKTILFEQDINIHILEFETFLPLYTIEVQSRKSLIELDSPNPPKHFLLGYLCALDNKCQSLNKYKNSINKYVIPTRYFDEEIFIFTNSSFFSDVLNSSLYFISPYYLHFLSNNSGLMYKFLYDFSPAQPRSNRLIEDTLLNLLSGRSINDSISELSRVWILINIQHSTIMFIGSELQNKSLEAFFWLDFNQSIFTTFRLIIDWFQLKSDLDYKLDAIFNITSWSILKLVDIISRNQITPNSLPELKSKFMFFNLPFNKNEEAENCEFTYFNTNPIYSQFQSVVWDSPNKCNQTVAPDTLTIIIINKKYIKTRSKFTQGSIVVVAEVLSYLLIFSNSNNSLTMLNDYTITFDNLTKKRYYCVDSLNTSNYCLINMKKNLIKCVCKNVRAVSIFYRTRFPKKNETNRRIHVFSTYKLFVFLFSMLWIGLSCIIYLYDSYVYKNKVKIDKILLSTVILEIFSIAAYLKVHENILEVNFLCIELFALIILIVITGSIYLLVLIIEKTTIKEKMLLGLKVKLLTTGIACALFFIQLIPSLIIFPNAYSKFISSYILAFFNLTIQFIYWFCLERARTHLLKTLPNKINSILPSDKEYIQELFESVERINNILFSTLIWLLIWLHINRLPLNKTIIEIVLSAQTFALTMIYSKILFKNALLLDLISYYIGVPILLEYGEKNTKRVFPDNNEHNQKSVEDKKSKDVNRLPRIYSLWRNKIISHYNFILRFIYHKRSLSYSTVYAHNIIDIEDYMFAYYNRLKRLKYYSRIKEAIINIFKSKKKRKVNSAEASPRYEQDQYSDEFKPEYKGSEHYLLDESSKSLSREGEYENIEKFYVKKCDDKQDDYYFT